MKDTYVVTVQSPLGPLHWDGDGWARRIDKAQQFATFEAADTARQQICTVSVVIKQEEHADAS